MVDLKSIYGGSIPSFLVKKKLVELGQMLVLHRCDMVEGSHEVILHLCVVIQLIGLLVWRRMLLK